MKRFKLLLLLSLLPALVFPRGNLSFDGEDWSLWDQNTKITYVRGYMTGVYAAAQMMVEAETITVDDIEVLAPILFSGATVYQVVAEVDAFYGNTHRLDYPLAMAVLIRNCWKNKRYADLPPWIIYRENFYGWK